MKIAIFGSAGFVGKNLLDAFTKKNIDLVSVDIVELNLPGVTHYAIDIQNKQDISKITAGCDLIINLAAHPLSKSFAEIKANLEVNVLGLVNILEAARNSNVKKIIFTSASSLIGSAVEGRVKESDCPNPKTPYGIAKLASEHLLRIYQENYGIDFTIFRFFNIYGPYQKGPALIPNVYSSIKSNQLIEVYGNGSQIRDYVFVPDIVEFFIQSMRSNAGRNKVINMGRGIGNSVIDVIEIASKILEIKPSIKFNEARKGEISNFVADTTLLKSEFGRVPQTTLRDGMIQTFAWLSKNS